MTYRPFDGDFNPITDEDDEEDETYTCPECDGEGYIYIDRDEPDEECCVCPECCGDGCLPW